MGSRRSPSLLPCINSGPTLTILTSPSHSLKILKSSVLGFHWSGSRLRETYAQPKINGNVSTKGTKSTKFRIIEFKSSVFFAFSFENAGRRDFGHSSRDLTVASFQHGVLESRFTRTFAKASLRTWMP